MFGITKKPVITDEEKKKEDEIRKQREIEAGKEAERIKNKIRYYVLPLSASDYALSRKKDLSSYDFRLTIGDRLGELVEEGENFGAEIITDVRYCTGSAPYLSSIYLGTALIPKDK